jgi:hypothetical protein
MLQQAKKNKPSLLERYAIFIREQQHTQKAGDVVSFVEMMRNYRMVHRAHKEALLATVSGPNNTTSEALVMTAQQPAFIVISTPACKEDGLETHGKAAHLLHL